MKDQHLIIHPHLEDWLKRMEADAGMEPLLFVYFHLRFRTFVIAEWVDRGRTFVDVENLGHSLRGFTRRRAVELRKKLFRNLSGGDLEKGLRQYERHRLLDVQAESDDKIKYQDWAQSSKVSVSMAGV